MNRVIQIHQVLHGYRNGHQLLSSSTSFPFFDRRLLDSMSDGAGIDFSNCKEGYITGYALPETKKYVLAKTWYADDMSRPGCVWTHSLVFDIDSIRKICSSRKIVELFHRPVSEKYDEYVETIFMSQEDAFDNVELEKLQYVVYTIYGTNQARYIEIEDDRYIESFIMAICHMPKHLLMKFSFCTNSLVDRYIDGKPFSYQMVMKDNTYKVCANITGKLYPQRDRALESPAWAREYAKVIVRNQLIDIENFMKIYEEMVNSFFAFNQLLRLFFITKELDGQYTLYDYYCILKKIYKDDYVSYVNCVISELINGNYFDDLFFNDFMKIIEIAEKNNRKIRREDKDKVVKKIISGRFEKVPEFLSGYIHGTLSKKSASIAKMIILQAKPENLNQISNMNHDIVVVAVATNNKLILSQDIWNLPRNYICDIINVLDSTISHSGWLKILSLILRKCNEDISDVVYRKAQDKLVPVLIELLQNQESVQYGDRIYIWDKFLLSDQLNLTRNLPKIKRKDLKEHLLLKIDTYNSEIRSALTLYEWIELFKSSSLREKRQRQDLAIKMLPLVLESEQVYPKDILVFVFGVIHQALAESQVTYEDWIKFESILPNVELCYAWDKCLRLRKAFEVKGYDINKLLQEYDNSF